MGAKAWMLLYAEGDPRPILRAAPPPDREATRTLVGRLHPGRRIVEIGDGPYQATSLGDDAMRELFGVTFGDPALEKIALAGFEVT